MFKLMLKSSFDQLLKEWKQYGAMDERQRQIDDKYKSWEITALDLLYKPVYMFSNEWEDPIVGFVTSVDLNRQKGSPIYTVFNWLSGDNCYTMSPRLWCNMDKSNDHEYSGVLPLMDINPYERWNLMNQHYGVMGLYREPPPSNEEPDLMSREGLHHELMVTGFFDLVEKVMTAERPEFARTLVMAAIGDNQSVYDGENDCE